MVTVRHLASSCHVCSAQAVTHGFDMEVFRLSFPGSQSYSKISFSRLPRLFLQGFQPETRNEKDSPRCQVDDWVGEDQHRALGRWCCTELGESFHLPTMTLLGPGRIQRQPHSEAMGGIVKCIMMCDLDSRCCSACFLKILWLRIPNLC